ncbi:hypothetical protein VR7878_01954 [Vibrio ruber DSM 16370]|uniref:Lipoprotein n=1 Tax=Vibrio ruber (strain DSM 16370 / JCM 11486 / BCRC 17186 / CECT 7878 / LMG 23124 / VR1) TaxID=1123498 RepID=A0A1R4LJX9_VIBR1|nr:hypothetical protein [Vibrio ruber]SJN56783.1 hypothetical protein VR7878_01954 [Vibrio ruber DSM 16370]
MNFGNVFTMPFKILLLIAFSGAACANIIQTKESLESQLQQQYESLNMRIEVCNTYKSRKIQITDKWLLSQTKQVQRIVIGELYKNAMNLCYRQEEREYVETLVKLAAIGDKKELNRYLNLKGKDTIDKRGLEILNQQHVNISELERLSKLVKYQIPFYPIID